MDIVQPNSLQQSCVLWRRCRYGQRGTYRAVGLLTAIVIFLILFFKYPSKKGFNQEIQMPVGTFGLTAHPWRVKYCLYLFLATKKDKHANFSHANQRTEI